MEMDIKKFNLALANSCLTLEELSKKSGVGRCTISRVKNDSQKATPRTLGKLAKALGVRVEDLLQKEQ